MNLSEEQTACDEMISQLLDGQLLLVVALEKVERRNTPEVRRYDLEHVEGLLALLTRQLDTLMRNLERANNRWIDRADASRRAT